MSDVPTAEQIDALLPQTQCGRCGFDGCRPYAEAISAAQAHSNRCSPGGATTIRVLASLLGLEPGPLDPECGDFVPGRIARVDEQWCLGCARCLAVCPVDAILGAPGKMHTVIAVECTGCERCIDPCPVDCIRMMPCESRGIPAGSNAAVAVAHGAYGLQDWAGGWARWQADRARRRYQARQLRLITRRRKRAAEHERKRNMATLHGPLGLSRRDAFDAVL
jgi:electron transport complex protein RnfB